jgi:hypothetical protein
MISVQKSDFIGMSVSALCFVHCLVTPFLFVVQTCSVSASCCSSSPLWWQTLDYVFLGISLIAVWFSTRKSVKQWVRIGLWVNWLVLGGVILFKEEVISYTFENIIFIPAITLILLHLYNNRFCKISRKTNANCAADCC